MRKLTGKGVFICRGTILVRTHLGGVGGFKPPISIAYYMHKGGGGGGPESM